MPKRAASFYDPSPGDSERLAIEKTFCRWAAEQLRVNPSTGKPCEFGERLIAQLAGSTLSMDERHDQLHQAAEIRGFLLEPAKLYPIAKLAEGTLRLHPFPLEAISVKKEVKEIRAAAIVAIQSGTLPGIDREPYSATFPHFCFWLRGEYTLREDAWIGVLYEHLEYIGKKSPSATRPQKPAPTNGATSGSANPGNSGKVHFADTSCSQLEITVTGGGLRVKRLGAAGRAKLYKLSELGLRLESRILVLLFEIAHSSSRTTAFKKAEKKRLGVAAHRFNKVFKERSGVSDNFLTISGVAITTTAGSIGTENGSRVT